MRVDTAIAMGVVTDLGASESTVTREAPSACAISIALADAAARWGHLWKEGLPYLTLLHNTINHPDDRGHRLFAEELWKCFR